jgi:fermentation-respiration switch protein FrsA (DUF1100 family)
MWTIPQSVIVWVIIHFLCGGFGFSMIYDKFLFYPSSVVQAPAQIAGAECQIMTIKEADGTEISCWYYKKPSDNGLMLVSHGNAGNLSHRSQLAAHLMLDSNCSVLLYDYQGYGNSQGKPSVKGILKDGLAAFDFSVDKLGYAPSKIIVYGESLGCAVTCAIASERKPEGMILQSGFRSLPTIARDIFGPLKLMPGFCFPEPKLDNEKLLKGEHAPLLILHGRDDEVIPFSHGEALYRSASQPKTFVPLEHSRHNDTFVADQETFDRSIADFVKTLGQTKADL